MVDVNTKLVVSETSASGETPSDASVADIFAGNAGAARTALGLGSAATQASSAFATAAEGAAAASAVQPVVAGSGIGGGGFAKHILLAGGAAGNFTATGIKVGDELDEVLYFIGAGTAVTDISDLTSQFTITGANTINNTGGTATTGGKLLVRWTKLTS
jgi:hypothetical protein